MTASDRHTVLVIEDDTNTAALVALYLERERFRVLTADDGKTGLSLAEQHRPDMVILDLMLPKMDGFGEMSAPSAAVFRRARHHVDRPGRRGRPGSRTDAGGRRLCGETLQPRELVARVKAVLRRSSKPATERKKTLLHADVQLDLEKRRLRVKGRSVALTPSRVCLARGSYVRPGRNFTRDELLNRLYPLGEAVVIDRVVDVHIGKLRQKIEPKMAHPRYILTVRGVGYRFVDRQSHEGETPVKRRLILKLLAVNLAVIAFVIIVVWLSIDTLAAGYFVTLMEKYHISPGPAHDMFVGAVRRYLLWACLAAVILAVVLSFVMMRRILAPLTRMTVVTREIAAGNFAERVPVGTQDEVGQLAQAFNRMASSLRKSKTCVAP